MICSLQTLRFVFALMIFHHHFFGHPQIIQFGTFPVAFFFILSGYVMAIGYDDKVHSPSFQYRSYLIKRLIRIVPLNLFCLGLLLILPITQDVTTHELHTSIYQYLIIDVLLLQAWIPILEIYFSGNAVAWFLSSILLSYILFPFLLKLIGGKNGKLLILVSLIIYMIGIHLIRSSVHQFIYISPFFRVVDFTLGITLYYALKGISLSGGQIVKGTVLELFAIIVAIFSLLVYPYVQERYGFASLYWVPSLLLIATFTFSNMLGGALSRLLSYSAFVSLGGLSFPFYMMHTIVIGWYRDTAAVLSLPTETVPSALFCIICTLIFAYLYTIYIEPKVTRKLQQKYL